MKRKTELLVGALALAMVSVTAAPARAQSEQHYDLSEQDLGAALKTFAAVSGKEVVASSDVVARKRSAVVRGDYAPEQAITLLLARTGLRFQVVDGAFVIRPLDTNDDAAVPAPDIVITGSRIRGAPSASPVIRLNATRLEHSGIASLGDAARSVPQSFGGGQNPAVGTNVPATNGVNVGGGSSFNLRGLGSDATLTLLNGHRLSYNSSRQSIDIGAIPLGAVESIEIVPDGASAIYGSDAVAGVANIILRRAFRGVETSARLGAATHGGDFEQRYGVVAGTQWASGGVVVTYEFARTTAIYGRQRSYAESAAPTLTLLPPIKNHSAVVTLRQDIVGGLSLAVDALYNRRWSTTSYASNAAGDITVSGNRISNDVESVAIAPTLSLALGGDWRIAASGSYGRDRTRFVSTTITASVATTTPRNCYCNSAVAAELAVDGTVFRLPAGAVKVALGAGYRSNRFSRFAGAGSALNLKREQDSYYGYGELALPLIAPDQRSPLGNSLIATAALRYERYPNIGEIVTPKLGLIYAPSPDFELKGSWGRSFRAPTLLQQYVATSAIAIAPSIFGGSGYPAGATALYVQGGNPALKPERARTWSATFEVHPVALPGARLSVGYFDVSYRDRIVTPIAFIGQSLSNPIYSDRIITNPGSGLVTSLVNSAADFANFTGGTFNPASVAVVIDNRNVNAGRQSARGVDLLASYRADFSPGRSLTATLDATYLTSEQQISATQPILQLAGSLFNPPHWRARGGLDWEAGNWGLSAFFNYTGDVLDARATAIRRVHDLATFDLSVRYATGASGPLGRIEFSLSGQNLFNARPARIATTFLSDAPYDSTNYSPVGRFIAFRVAKPW